jgi:hypothetical protein
MGKTEGQESDRPEDNGRWDDTSSRIMKYEIHIDNYVHYRWRRVSDAWYCNIVGLRTISQKVDALRHSYESWFCLAAMIDTVRKQYLFFEYINNIFVLYFTEIRETGDERRETGDGRRKSSKHAKHAKHANQCFWWTIAQVTCRMILSWFSLMSE